MVVLSGDGVCLNALHVVQSNEGEKASYTNYENPFAGLHDPEKYAELMEEFQMLCANAGVQTGVLRTRLALPGMEQSGAKAARGIIEHFRPAA